ncbi:MAG: hypothetical protein IPG29_13360 [Sphingobacteriales bacterium]|nr:hypothetical protein [Sphingobacteriales bacterium]
MKNLRLSLAALFCLVAILASCGKPGNVAMDPAKQKQKVDSIVAAQTTAFKAEAEQKCQTRMQTEVQAKADSMVNAKKAQAAAATPPPAAGKNKP